jgi:hypothetical protein
MAYSKTLPHVAANAVYIGKDRPSVKTGERVWIRERSYDRFTIQSKGGTWTVVDEKEIKGVSRKGKKRMNSNPDDIVDGEFEEQQQEGVPVRYLVKQAYVYEFAGEWHWVIELQNGSSLRSWHDNPQMRPKHRSQEAAQSALNTQLQRRELVFISETVRTHLPGDITISTFYERRTLVWVATSGKGRFYHREEGATESEAIGNLVIAVSDAKKERKARNRKPATRKKLRLSEKR